MGWQEYKQLPLVELMTECTIVVAETVLFLPINKDFCALFKQWEWQHSL